METPSAFGLAQHQSRTGLNRGLSFETWARGRGWSFERISAFQRLGAYGLPRHYPRCMWPVGPCAPGCTAKHVDLDAMDETKVAA